MNKYGLLACLFIGGLVGSLIGAITSPPLGFLIFSLTMLLFIVTFLWTL